jgi:hypothetical protein
MKTVTARNLDKVESTSFSKTDLVKSVRVTPNGEDTSTTNSPQKVNDFFDNEISFGSEENIVAAPTSRSSPVFNPTIEYSTKVSSSSSTRSVSSTVKLAKKPQTTTEVPSTIQTTQEVQATSIIPSTTEMPITTENYIARNYKLLQQLLADQNSKSQTRKPVKSTTELPTTFSQGTQKPVEITTEVPSTIKTTVFERRTKAPSTTWVETATERMTTEKLTTERTTTAERTTTERTTTERLTTERQTTEPTTTERITTTQEPSTIYTKPLITTAKPKPKAPFSDTEDLAFLVRIFF